jgi:transcriptional regulator with XRE-family HTH domain
MSITAEKPQHIGRKIERIRELRGMKQDTLATALGITQQAVSKMEASENVDDERLQKVATALGVTPDAIRNFNEDAIFNNINNTFHDNSALVIISLIPSIKSLNCTKECLKLKRRKMPFWSLYLKNNNCCSWLFYASLNRNNSRECGLPLVISDAL